MRVEEPIYTQANRVVRQRTVPLSPCPRVVSVKLIDKVDMVQFNIVTDNTVGSTDQFSISDTDSFICATVGDMFYLVINRKQEILLAYSAKCFDYPK